MNSDASGLIDIRALAEASRQRASERQPPETWGADAIEGLLGIGTGAPVGTTLSSPMRNASVSAGRDRTLIVALSALMALIVVAGATVAIVAVQLGDRRSVSEDAPGSGPIEARLEPAIAEVPASDPVLPAPAETEPAAEPAAPAAAQSTAEEQSRRPRPRRRRARSMRRTQATAPADAPPPRGDRTLEQLLDDAVRR